MGWVSALRERRLFRRGFPLALLLLIVVAVAAGTAVGTTTTCANPATLNGSAFEIDTDANQVVDTSGCKDWLNTGPGPGPIIKADSQSGATDESFGNGTKEDTAQPSVVDGSIPPNKSDLKAFGVYTESGETQPYNPTGKFLELLWTRVQDPSGTTNMDFELNQKFCDLSADPTNCAANGITPLRTQGDKLITYDLSRGGTRATMSIRTWNGSAWGPATELSNQNPVLALGTINTQGITAGNSLSSLGALSPRTFGEASIAFSALFGENTCGQFGSAYLKSRASDSFTAALKDFVPPQQVSISNCTALETEATTPVTVGDQITDTATLTGASNPTGDITFKLYGSLEDCNNDANVLFSDEAEVDGTTGSATSGPYTTTATGTLYWLASYEGDANNAPAEGACDDAGEQSVVNPAAPEIATSATAEASIGDQITDTATLTGGSNPTGDITFKLYGSLEDCNNDANVLFSDTVAVNANGSATSAPYTTTAAGTLYWLASYEGDDNNDPVSGACDDADEQTVVGKAPANISTTQRLFPQDSATLSANAGGTPTGTVDFALHAGADCSGTPVFTQENVDLTNGTANTNNTDFSVDQASSGDYKWIVHYDGDATHDEATSECGKEAFTATIDNDTSN